MSKVIAPTPGRVVLFFPHISERVDQNMDPLPAIICKVIDERTINAVVFSEVGATFSQLGITLVQPGDPIPTEGGHVEWMPFQIGQARAQQSGEGLGGKIVDELQEGMAFVKDLAKEAHKRVDDVLQMFDAVDAKVAALQASPAQPAAPGTKEAAAAAAAATTAN